MYGVKVAAKKKEMQPVTVEVLFSTFLKINKPRKQIVFTVAFSPITANG